MSVLYQFRRSLDRRRTGAAAFTIISEHCWGAEVYRYLERPYNTPFVGLFLEPPCFLRLASDPRRYLSEPLRFISRSRYDGPSPISNPLNYPVAELLDVEIHFLHYADKHEAQQKWNRRRERMDWSSLRLHAAVGKSTWTDEMVAQYLKLPAALALTHNQDKRAGGTRVAGYRNDGRELFEPSTGSFDLPTWLKTGEVLKPPLYSRLRRRPLILRPSRAAP